MKWQHSWRWFVLLAGLLGLTLMPFTGSAQAYSGQPKQFVLIDTVDNAVLPPGVRVVERYDAFVLAEVPLTQLPTLQRDSRVDLLPERTRISLNGVAFDTTVGEPRIDTALRAASDDPYFLVQFYGPVKNEWVDTLEAMGVTFLGYHPHYTYIVRMDPALLGKVRVAHAVQWVGHYHPAYRFTSYDHFEKAFRIQGLTAFRLSIFPNEDIYVLQQRIEALGISVNWETNPPPGNRLARVWGLPEQLPALAAIPGIYRIEPYIAPTLDNEQAAQVMNTWNVWRSSRSGLLQDLMGSGQTAGMVDSGLDSNTLTPNLNDFYEFDNGIQATRISAALPGSGCGQAERISGTNYLCNCYSSDHELNSGHGTHVAGSIVGNGYNALLQLGLEGQARTADPNFDYAFGVGQAPEAHLAYSYVGGELCYRSGSNWVCGHPDLQGFLCGIDWGAGTSYTTWLNLYNSGARNVNNSWGSSDVIYAGDALLADQVMWERQDYLIVTSAGNAGPGWATIGQPGNAKNLITVGAAGNHRPTWGQSSDTASLLTDFSSRGPLNPTGSDYRFKPDVVAPGADILSTRSTYIANDTVTLWMNEPGDGDGNGQQDYWWSGGTSMSSPLVTGAATIVRQYLQNIKGLGNTTPPSAALIKAMLVNGAVDMGYGYEAFTTSPYGGRNLQGWGMVNVENTIIPPAPRSFIYEDYTNITNSTAQSTIGLTASGRYVEYTFNVMDASEPLKVTLTWTDLQTGASGYAVNNLNLLVTVPGGGTSYIGNVFSGSWSATGGAADTRNNTEAVYVQNPAVGTWTIRVTDAAHGSGTQPFALLVSGGLGPDPTFISRTCSWGACPSTRSGNSSHSYFPSLKPLSGSDEQIPAGASFTTDFRLTNWGTNADTLALSYSVTDQAGATVSGITVDFTPPGPFNLASATSQDIEATVHVGAEVSVGAYDVSIIATSAGTGNRRNALVVGLNVIPHTNTFNERRVVLDSGPQFAHAVWGTGQTIWTAYLSAQSHNNSEAEIHTARSTDGGQTWTAMGQVDANDGRYYYSPAIAGNADGTSVTVVWAAADANGVFARTWTAGSGWGTIRTLNGSTTYLDDPAVIYDNNGDILAVWLYYDGTSATGLRYAVSTNNGGSWSAATSVPDATGGTHRWQSLTLDTRNNHVWMAYAAAVSGANRDISAKYWNGNTNAWVAGAIAVATTAEREIRPVINYVQGATATADALWIAWVRYPGWTNVTPRLYYTRSSGILPGVTFPTTYGPYATRIADPLAPAITGDATYTYISYLAYTDGLRGSNIFLLQIPAAGGAPTQIYQTATMDSAALNTRGNAGTPCLLWATTTINGVAFTGPTLLYSKNAPNSESPNYGNRGTAQTLFEMRENFDLYLTQARPTPRPITYADTQGRCAGNMPCYNNFQKAVDDVDSGGTVFVYPRPFNADVAIDKNVTVNFVGISGETTTLNNLTLTNGTVNAPAGTLTLLGDFTRNGGTINHNSGTVAFGGLTVQTIGGTASTTFYNLIINNVSGVTLSQAETVNGTLTLTSGSFAVSANLMMGNGATISRAAGNLSAAPTFGATVNVEYTGSTGVTTGAELPTVVTVLNDLTIDNSGGVTLSQNQTVNGTLTLTNGHLVLGANILTLDSTAVVAATPDVSRMIVADGNGMLCKGYAGIGSFIFPVGDETGTTEYSPAALNFTAGTFVPGLGQACVRVVNARHPNNSSAIYLNRYWIVESVGITDFSCTTTFNYTADDVAGTGLETDIRALRYHNSVWTMGDAVDADNNTFAMTVNVFSNFTGGNNPTAVTLASFEAIGQDDAILITWETASELNNVGFNLYRSESFDGPWAQLNTTLIPPQYPGSVLGGVYEWWDTLVRPGEVYYYRLEDIDISGARTFHGPVWATAATNRHRVYLPLVLRP